MTTQTISTGRYFVQRQTIPHEQWVVQDLATNPSPTVAGPYPTEADAQAACTRLNTPPRPRQRTRQPALFDTPED
ncbi:MAG: hypothetical protein JWP11_3696 [Frankiales bacterium]|nr:hypothetical protein [Frankiales bacterium]